MLPLLFVPQMLFAGFFVAPPLIPGKCTCWFLCNMCQFHISSPIHSNLVALSLAALRWARFLCSLTYAVRLIALNEFDYCLDPESVYFSPLCVNLATTLFSTTSPVDTDTQLDMLDDARDDQWWYWLAMLVIFVALRLLALFVLQKKATKFF